MRQQDLPVLLASQSPRRQELLRGLGVTFECVAADIDEGQLHGEAPVALVQRLARAKALAVAAWEPARTVLAADTIVVLDGAVLGKPAGEGEAVAMLRALRSRDHQVLSAVFALSGAKGQQAAELSETRVWMRDYSDAEIAAYVASGDPMDKAGAYAIQSNTFAPVARLDGCFSGVMGFPLGHVLRVLVAVGVPVSGDVVAVCLRYSADCCLAVSRGGDDHREGVA